MVNNSKAYQVAKYAITFATIFVAMMLDRVISLGLPTATAACVLLVTFSFSFLDNKWLTGVLSCMLFGLASFIKEFIFPSAVAALPVYWWPVVTIVPRVAMGAVAFGVYRLMQLLCRKMLNRYLRQTVCITVATFFGLACITVLFLSVLNLANRLSGQEYQSLVLVIKAVLVTNIIPEYLVSMILVPHVVLGVRRGLKLGVEPHAHSAVDQNNA